MTQPGAPSASPPDLPAQSGQDRAADSKIVATWFAENLSSQDGAWLATSSSRTSLAASPPLMRCVYLKQWTQTGAIVVEPSHHESTDPRLSASHAARAARASRGWPSCCCGVGRTGSRLTTTEKVKECPRTIQALIDVLLIRVAHVLRVDLELVPRLDQLIFDRSHRVSPSGSVPFVSASHAALCTACHGVRSHPVPVALVGPVVPNLGEA